MKNLRTFLAVPAMLLLLFSFTNPKQSPPLEDAGRYYGSWKVSKSAKSAFLDKSILSKKVKFKYDKKKAYFIRKYVNRVLVFSNFKAAGLLNDDYYFAIVFGPGAYHKLIVIKKDFSSSEIYGYFPVKHPSNAKSKDSFYITNLVTNKKLLEYKRMRFGA